MKLKEPRVMLNRLKPEVNIVKFIGRIEQKSLIILVNLYSQKYSYNAMRIFFSSYLRFFQDVYVSFPRRIRVMTE
jgi:hypothetical protein